MKKLVIALFCLGTTSLHALAPSICNSCEAPCNDLCGLFFGAEGLFWTTCQSNLAFSAEFDPTDANKLVGKGDIHYLKHDWRGGARGWFGWQCCGWNGRFVYTWFRNRAGSTKSGEENVKHLRPMLYHPAAQKVEALTAKAKHKFEYQTLDFLTGHTLVFEGCDFWFEPFFGLRGLKINQDFEIKYTGLDFEDHHGHIDLELELEAAGLHGGIDMLETFCDCLGLYGSIAGSILYGRTDDKHRQKSEFKEVNLNDKEYLCVPGIHLAGGFSWYQVCDYYYTLMIKLGYEFTHWFNVPSIRTYYDEGHEGVSRSGNYSKLTVHGVTLRVEFGF